MSCNPELIVPYVFITDELAGLFVSVDDGVEHLHVAPLWVDRPDRLLVKEDLVEVDLGKIVKILRRHSCRNQIESAKGRNGEPATGDG
jgi:hypothetical protein